MTPDLILQNLLLWSLQIAVLSAAAALIRKCAMVEVPRITLAYWQAVLSASLLLPLLRPWKQEIADDLVQISSSAFTVAHRTAPASVFHLSLPAVALLLLFAGTVVRLAWLLLGVWRLNRYRRNSQILDCSAILDHPAIKAELRISPHISGPATFGFLRPVVLVPAVFPTLGPEIRDAILRHELRHVERRDWLFTLAEEFVCALFWFHPAVWWLVSEIRLSREEAVDLDVITATGRREQYIDALLAVAGASPAPLLSPAPPFLRAHRLKQRVVAILKDVPMSKTRRIVTLAASLTMLAVSCWLVTGALPLHAAPPQELSDGPGISVDTNDAVLVHRTGVSYPAEAVAIGAAGPVVVEVKLDAAAAVTDANIVSGPDTLRKAVVQSVLAWHFAKEFANSSRRLTVTFQPALSAQVALPPAARPAQDGIVIRGIRIEDVSDRAREELLARLPVHAGNVLTRELRAGVNDVPSNFDSHLRPSVVPISATEGILAIGIPQAIPAPAPASGGRLRIAGSQAQNNIVSRVTPAYPPAAKAARLQGVVHLEATIGKDGHVIDLQVLSGPDELIESSLSAVRQWLYQPTLLNGNPVEIVTTIDVNYTLRN